MTTSWKAKALKSAEFAAVASGVKLVPKSWLEKPSYDQGDVRFST